MRKYLKNIMYLSALSLNIIEAMVDFSNQTLNEYDFTNNTAYIDEGRPSDYYHGANFSGASLINCIFTGLNLTGADFTDADLSDADLPDTILININLTNTTSNTSTDIGNAIILNATGSFTYSSGTPITNPQNLETSLVSKNLSNANLSNLDLMGANLTGANLTGINLTNADLTRSILTGADLTGSTIKKAQGFLHTDYIGTNINALGSLKTIATYLVLSQHNNTPAPFLS